MALSDRQRVELALPARIMFAAAVTGAEDPEDPQAQVVLDHLRAAANEPLRALGAAAQGKLARRIERDARELLAGCKDFTAAKVALVGFYLTELLISEGVLELFEGSSMAEGTHALMSVLPEDCQGEFQEASARKQARRMLEHARRLGYYGGSR